MLELDGLDFCHLCKNGYQVVQLFIRCGLVNTNCNDSVVSGKNIYALICSNFNEFLGVFTLNANGVKKCFMLYFITKLFKRFR